MAENIESNLLKIDGTNVESHASNVDNHSGLASNILNTNVGHLENTNLNSQVSQEPTAQVHANSGNIGGTYFSDQNALGSLNGMNPGVNSVAPDPANLGQANSSQSTALALSNNAGLPLVNNSVNLILQNSDYNLSNLVKLETELYQNSLNNWTAATNLTEQQNSLALANSAAANMSMFGLNNLDVNLTQMNSLQNVTSNTNLLAQTTCAGVNSSLINDLPRNYGSSSKSTGSQLLNSHKIKNKSSHKNGEITEDYKKKREKNNIAVRKSRAKVGG